jgi:two-component system, NarL family, sensor kinase
MDTKIILVISAVMFTMVILLFLFGFIIKYQKKSISFQTEKKVMQSAFEQELLKSQLEIQEQTLKNISQEIHDNIGQVLSLAKLHLATADAGNPGSMIEKVANSKELITKAIQDLRSLSKSLDTDTISAIGLYNAAKNELDSIEKAGFHQTHLVLEGALYKLGPEVELILFRVLQELLNNIIKHAGAKNITVHFNYLPQKLQMKIMDDGTGFDLNNLNNHTSSEFGLGLKNMHNRAKIINAEFLMESKPGAGTTVFISADKP